MEGLPDQPGLTTGTRLKGNSGVEDMSRITRAFAGTGHTELIAAGRARVLGKQYLEVKIPYPFFIYTHVFENSVDLMDQGIANQRLIKRRHIW